MNVRARVARVRHQFLSAVHSRPVALGTHGPFVSFCFDDFPRSACTHGSPILRRYAAHGTYYAALGLMNTANHLGPQMTLADIDTLLAEGHEIGSHTLGHTSCRRVTQSEFEKDVRKGRDAIRDRTGLDPVNFSYPYGHVTARLKRSIGNQMGSCRGIYGGVNSQFADLNLLRANSLYGDTTALEYARHLLDENRTCRGWLIFYTHDVRENPSPFGCTPALLEECVRLAASSGCQLYSVREVLQTIQRR